MSTEQTTPSLKPRAIKPSRRIHSKRSAINLTNPDVTGLVEQLKSAGVPLTIHVHTHININQRTRDNSSATTFVMNGQGTVVDQRTEGNNSPATVALKGTVINADQRTKHGQNTSPVLEINNRCTTVGQSEVGQSERELYLEAENARLHEHLKTLLQLLKPKVGATNVDQHITPDERSA